MIQQTLSETQRPRRWQSGGLVIALLSTGCTGEIAPIGSASGVTGATNSSGIDGTSVVGTGVGGAAGATTGTTTAGTGMTGAACDAIEPVLEKPLIWRLTQAELANTLRDSFGFVPPSVNSMPVEARLDGFANQAAKLTISPLLAETFFVMGGELGAFAATNPDAFGIACDVAALAAGSCLNAFLATTGQKMWRRPLTDAQLASLSDLFEVTAGQGGPAEGVTSVVQTMFMSPNFLHRTELGSVMDPDTVTQLTDYELASALSYLIWDSAPDEELLTLASQSQLSDETVLIDQARRMFEQREKSEPAMNDFLRQWLHLEVLPNAAKDTNVFPMATPEVLADLNQELTLFTNSVLFDQGGDRSLRTLFTATYSFVNERTAPLYGITDVTGTSLVRRDLNPAERRGVMSMVPFLWGQSHAADTGLVSRGAYFRSEVLCDRIALPADGVPPGAFPPPDATGRERLTIHSSPPCASCHAFFDGIGFALENYDAIGRFRTTEYGKPVDPSGSLPLPSEGNQSPGLVFANFVDLVDQLGERPDVYSCFAQQYTSYAFGRDIPEIDECAKNEIISKFTQANYRVDELVLSVISSPNFMRRRN